MDPGSLRAAYRRDRRRLVERLRGAGIDDLAVLHAFDTVPRHLFVPEGVRPRAYEDVALPIGHGQTISRPGVHARCLEAAELEGEERVLEVGTGSGFQTALLATLVRAVYSIEVVPELAARARDLLAALDLDNVALRTGDGTAGWPDSAPFDVILVTAAAAVPPQPLIEQLAEGGRLLLPLEGKEGQELRRGRKGGGAVRWETLETARFVPLRGAAGEESG